MVGEHLQQHNPNYDNKSYPGSGLTLFSIRIDRGVPVWRRLIPEWFLYLKKKETEKRSWLQGRD